VLVGHALRVEIVLLVLVAAGAGAVSAFAATPKTVPVPAAIVYRTASFPAKNDPKRCIAVAFLQYSTVPKATSYSVLAKGHKGSSNVPGGGPPFKQDAFKLTTGKKTVTFRPPAGKHWFALGTSSTGQGCAVSTQGLKGRFSVAHARATVG